MNDSLKSKTGSNNSPTKFKMNDIIKYKDIRYSIIAIVVAAYKNESLRIKYLKNTYMPEFKGREIVLSTLTNFELMTSKLGKLLYEISAR